MNDMVNFLDLGWPVILSATLIALQFFIHTAHLRDSRVAINILGILTFETPISRIIVLRSLLVVASLVSLAVPAFRNYADYFPTKYNMEVFFDNNGIQESLMQFSEEELKRLPLKVDWEQDKKNYLEKVDSYLQAQLAVPFYFGLDSAYVHSKGSTSFEVKKVKGWQRYHIVESKGSLTHILEVPGDWAPEPFKSEFELLQTANNYIDSSLLDIYVTFTKVLMPMYKQVISLPKRKEPFHHTLMAVTKIRVFPVIDVSRTVYFVRVNNVFVPIGYCIYEWD